MDQKQAGSIAKIVGVFFLTLSVFMLFLSWAIMQSEGKSGTEYLIIGLSFGSGILLLFGGINYLKSTIAKEKDIKEYENRIRAQVNTMAESGHSTHEKTTLKKDENSQEQHATSSDVIAHWEYTPTEWKKMKKVETTRRRKEGIWVTIGIGILGGLAIRFSRDASFLSSFMISFSVGILLSWLKIKFSNDMFSIRANNTITFTSKALLINNSFKIIRDSQFHLEYVKPIEIENDKYLEFSLQWQTRGGATNDQFRIYAPPHYEQEIPKILNFYSILGVKTTS
ncbi:MAG: hypothetical protein NTW54_08790 [Bacteroidetes bacterium]|nr:hypothetical protein [Bacteroidota bacterium]